jgi:ParB family chromosome partitioning protein
LAKDDVRNSIKLASVDDLFPTEEGRAEAKSEKIIIVPAEDVHPYVRQPYQTARLTQDLVRLLDSIGRHGIETPLIARPRAEGGYEIISGHRRDYCAEMHNIPDRPLIVRNYTDDEADILVADLNIVREENLPSELARAYKLRYDAMKRQGKRTDLTSGQFEQKLPTQNSRRELADTVGKTEDEVRRLLRLNELIPEILQMVDENKIAVRPASEISHLPKEQQQVLFSTMGSEDCTPSLPQAIKMKQFSQDGRLNDDVILSILTEEKPNQKEKFNIQRERIDRFFPKSFSEKQKEDLIIQLLEGWYKKRQHEQER